MCWRSHALAIRRALDFVNELRGSSITMDSLLREEDPASTR